MAPVAQDDIDIGSHASDFADSQDSPPRRQFSEPLHPLSNSIRASPSPTPSVHRVKCVWCGKYFESTDDDPLFHEEALKEHIATVHPHIVKFTMYDGADDEEGEEGEEGEEEQGDEAEEMEDEEEEVEQTPVDESELALSNQLHEFSRQQETVSVEKRLESFWNIHKANNFSADYDDEVADLEHTWDHAFRESKRVKKRDSPERPGRPNPYEKPSVAKGEFLKITPIEAFLEQLRDPESKPFDELYAITSNVAHALKVWQDEYLAIDRLSKQASRHTMKKTPNPRKTENPDVFEDKKESILYGYKYDAKEVKIGNQDPFVQGGFKPTAAQMRKMTAQAGPDNPNPDGWKPVVKFGVEHIPRFQNAPIEHHEGKATRKRKAAQMEVATKVDEVKETTMAATAAVETENDTDAHPAKRQTRSRGGKHLATREIVQARTAPPSPAPGRRGGYSGRGGRRPRVLSSTPQPPTITPARASARTSTRIPGAAAVQTPVPLQARLTPAPTFAPAAPPIAPATSAAPMSTTTAPPTTIGAIAGTDAALDPVELARRQKIASSKNPKRTEAMLNHWAKFNREGRIRNPKRTKAQIEADRAAEASKRTVEPPKSGVRKRKSTGSITNGFSPGAKRTKLEASVPPPVQPMPAANSLPLPPTSSHRPYAPYDALTVIPHGYNPGPPVNLGPPPPHPHPMAYAPHPGYPADYYIHYGAPPHPPPSHHSLDGHPRPA